MLTLRNVAINVGYYGITLFALPAALLIAERRLGWAGSPRPAWRVAALVIALPGAALQLWCIVLFQRIGRGTPSPLLPTRSLVRRGPYRRVRNPMNLGELAVFAGLALWFASPILAAYVAAAALVFHAFVVWVEEPWLAAQHGAAYDRYRRAVRRWLPRWRSMVESGRGDWGDGLERHDG